MGPSLPQTCMWPCMFVQNDTYINRHRHTYMHAHPRKVTYVCSYTYVYIQHIDICTYTCTSLHVCIHIYIFIYIYTQTHADMYLAIHLSIYLWSPLILTGPPSNYCFSSRQTSALGWTQKLFVVLRTKDYSSTAGYPSRGRVEYRGLWEPKTYA